MRHYSSSRIDPSRHGFTLIEVLLVVTIIILLVSFLIPGLKFAVSSSRKSTCASDLGSLLQAYNNYAWDNSKLIVGSDTGRNPWDWLQGGNSPASIINGKLWPYVLNASTYVCPDQVYPNYLNSYSMNGMLNGEQKWTSRANGSTTTGAGQTFNQNMQTHIPKNRLTADMKPSLQKVFLEEDDARGWNWNSFMLGGAQGSFIDWVAANHKGGDNLGYLDGHTEHWEWQTPFLRKRPKPAPPAGSDPGNVDWNRLLVVFKTWPSPA